MTPTGKTRITVRVNSGDAKVIGSLVGGCRITIRNAVTGALLAQGLHVGGSGDTELIMKQPRRRRATVFGTEGTAAFVADLDLAEPTFVEIVAEGPLAFPQALQRASKTTWLLPAHDIVGEGILFELSGFIVDIMTPASVDVLHSYDPVHLLAGVRLL